MSRMKVVRGCIGWPVLVLGGLLFLIMGWDAVGYLFKYGFTLPPGGDAGVGDAGVGVADSIARIKDTIARVHRVNVYSSYIGTCVGLVVAFVGFLIIDKR